jgi:acetyl-CoA/propionyl-CoA carboxylase biotin carboxyl carrier protein
MEYEVTLDGKIHRIQLRRTADGGLLARVGDGPERSVRATRLGTGELALEVEDFRLVSGIAVRGERVSLQFGARDWTAQVVDARKAGLRLGKGGAAGAIVTQMPGVVSRVVAPEGAVVAVGDPVVVVEAMKMENEFRAPIAGVVAKVHVAPGQAVETGTLLALIE